MQRNRFYNGIVSEIKLYMYNCVYQDFSLSIYTTNVLLRDYYSLLCSVLECFHVWLYSSSVPVDFLRPKFRVAHTKDDIIRILMHKYTHTNMYIIKKIISRRFILC